MDSKYSLDEVLEKFSTAKITNVELTSGRGYVEDIKELLGKYKFNFLVHNYFPEPRTPFILNFASLNDKIRFKSINHAMEGIRLSSRLGSYHYAIHAGFLYDPDGSIDEKTGLFKVPTGNYFDRGKAIKNYIDSLLNIYNYAKSKSIRLLVENNVCAKGMENKLLLSEYKDFEELFEKIGNLKIGVLLDFGHLKVSSLTLNFSSKEFIDKIRPRIAAFHIHDNDGTGDFHKKLDKDSWILKVLEDKNFKSLPKTLEANNLDTDGILEQLKLLNNI